MFLNSNGHGQALQFLAQGYSDSIKAKTSNQGVAMANAFNQGLSNAVQTHDNHEQAMQNREATRLQNEYMNRTMDDRVRHQAQQTKANDLANEYTERTLDDRVAHEEQKTLMNGLEIEGKWLNNNLQAMKNDTFKRTQESDISATNAINYLKTADAQKQKTITDLQHAAYKGTEQPIQDENGNYYLVRYDKENGKSYREYIHEDDAKRRDETNRQMAATRKATTQGETSSQQANTTALQAQTAQNINSMENANQQKAAFDEAKANIQSSGDTKAELITEINLARRNGETEITLRNGTKMPIQMAELVSGYPAGANGGGVNVNGGFDTAWKAGQAGFSEIEQFDKQLSQMNPSERDKYLKIPEAQATIRQSLQKIIHQNTGKAKNISQQAQQISSMNHVLGDMSLLQGQRFNVLLGHVTQYFGGDESAAAKAMADFAQNRGVIQGLKDITGAASNKDMQNVESLSYQMYKNDAYNARVLYAMQRSQLDSYNKLINEIGGSPTLLLGLQGGEDLYNKYLAAQVMVQTYEKNFK
ncbi:hypothetical protein [Helicobacter bilis]|uniref:hypothetical protein n=1 Tax=Helicobacter bilis TaxID=37372 RepID=UPI002557D0DA|nr:hypothetical protein [Helicobacter bilis]